MRDRVIAAEKIKIANQRKGREKPRKCEKPQILDSEPDDPREKAKKKVLKSYKIPKKGVAASLIASEQVNSKKVSKMARIRFKSVQKNPVNPTRK